MNFKVALFLFFSSVLMAVDIEDIKRSMAQNYIEQMKNIETIRDENENFVEDNFIYYKNILNKVREYYLKFIKEKWGDENVRISNRSSFTQYSKNLNSRETIDFKNGKIVLEKVVGIDEDVDIKEFKKRVKELKNETISQAIKRDPVAKTTNKYLKKWSIVLYEDIKSQEKFLDGLIDDKIELKDIKKRVIKLDNKKKRKIVSLTVPMTPKYLQKLAKRYEKDVLRYSKKFNVSTSCIFATIETESYFNPFATSYVPAYGLMQIVPSTAGKDAYYALTGKEKLLSPSYLYNPTNNIELGSKYIDIISHRYLKGIKDKESLFYCSCVAYNAGIGNLIKAFAKDYDRKRAIEIINSMNSSEVYAFLRSSKKLSSEAKEYVKKLRENRKHYDKI